MIRPLPFALMIAAALTGAMFELLRRWWVDLARRPVGRWP